MKVLLADDDPDILDITAYALRRDGFQVTLATDGAKALKAWCAERHDVVLLDVAMPKLNGFEVLRSIRQESDTGVIMVTARTDEEDIVRGLRLGADDYVTKPFSPRQLSERIRSVARRSQTALPEAVSEIEAGGMVLELESHQVSRGGSSVRVTPIEFRILHVLMLNAGRVIPTDRLIEKVWGFDGGDSRMLKSHICHLRKRLRLRPGGPGYVSNVPGVGYTLERGEERAVSRAAG